VELELLRPSPRHRYNDIMHDVSDVLVIGGGVIGLSTAYYLARGGVRITIIDQAEFGRQASWAGAGILPPGDPALARTPYDALRAHSTALFPKLSQELLAETGIDNGYVVSGGLEFPEDSAGPPTDEWRSEGITFELLDRQALSRILPGIAPHFEQAYLLPQMAQVRNPWHLHALQAACERRGVRLVPHCPVRSLLLSPNRVAGVDTDRGQFLAERYLVCAGAWTEGLLAPLGWRPGIRPIRGQIALLHTDQPFLQRILLCGKRYIVPRSDGRLLVGSTEEDAGFDARPTGGGIAGLLSFAASLLPSLAAAPLERCWAGLRPGSPDGMPYLGQLPGWDNLYVAAGHFRAGLQLSPGTGLALSEVLQGRTPPVPLEAFRPDRPQPPEAERAFRS
jgi:glycine oxidase